MVWAMIPTSMQLLSEYEDGDNSLRKICMSYLKRKMGSTQTMNKMELPMSIFVSATSREDSDPDDDSDLQAAAFRSLRVVTTVVTVTTTITTPGRPTPYTIESNVVMSSWIISISDCYQ